MSPEKGITMARRRRPMDEKEEQLQLLVRLGQKAAEAIEAASKPPAREVIRSALADLDQGPRVLVGLLGEAVASVPELEMIETSFNRYLSAVLANQDVVERFVAPVPPPIPAPELSADEILSISRIRGEAQHWILGYPKYDAEGVAKALGSSATNSRQTASRLRLRGELLGLLSQGSFMFPAFQFDVARARIWPIVAEVNKELNALEDPWGVASFWFTVDPMIGAEPYQLVSDGDAADQIRFAVRALTAPVG